MTAFIVESYKQQPEDTTSRIFIQISPQLWFYELLAYETMIQRKGSDFVSSAKPDLSGGKVFAIASTLPLLLQLALLPFFVGLSVFLQELNSTLGWITTSVMMVWLSAFLIMIATPAFSSQWPYKFPTFKALLSRLRVRWTEWPDSLTSSLRSYSIPRRRCRDLHLWAENITNRFRRMHEANLATQENSLCKDASLDLITTLCAQNVLHRERGCPLRLPNVSKV